MVQVGILTIATAVTAIAIFELVTIPSSNQADQALYDQWSAVANGLDLQGGRVVYPPGRLPQTSPITQEPIEIDVFTESGLLVQTEKQSLSPAYLSQQAATVLHSGGRVGPLQTRDASRAGRRVYAAAQPLGDPPNQQQAAVIVSLSTADLDALRQRLLGSLLLGSGLVIVSGGVLAWLLVGRTLRPVRAIAAAARDIGDQELDRRVTVPAPPDEVGELKATFNEMLARLEKSFKSLRQFTADASHELRSPLTLMRTEVDVALTRQRTPLEYQRVLGRVQREIEHLGRVADQMLLLAQADAGQLLPQRVALDVPDLTEEVAARWRRTALERGIELRVDAPEAGIVLADPDLVRRVLDNLLDNALRHSPETGQVNLSAARQGQEWWFEVSDEGAGVPIGIRESVFERFTRADSARGRRSGGAGLGLALSAAVARAHGGTLELLDDPAEMGATFRLRLAAPTIENGLKPPPGREPASVNGARKEGGVH
ncbi:MAG: HAMP domain-containing protein [Candidatus Dormibacteraeota bacterium]|uniref:histidine kinase n=1 Tax=Candidatus Dormiibacter inghamiae TaxID=3127013 RepID=A0A934KJD0_9BACT|nr:HAMP domain-containing protein [Candidatus Dormibacteraeota bacterium]MBJ7605771.1 HAMP domain-containing protein [Candidatus Dormibacteraeota bacterium]